MSADMSVSGDYVQESELFREFDLRNLHRVQISAQAKYYGYGICFVSIMIGLLFLYAVVISKLLPDTQFYFLDSIKLDHYFCYLIPLTLLPTVVVIYLNWLAMRLFEQN